MAFVAAPPSRTLYVTHETGIIPSLEAKDPNDVVRYMWALADWLEVEGTTVQGFACAIDSPSPSDLVKQSEDGDAAPPVYVSILVSGGTHGVDYIARLRLTLANGTTVDKSFRVPVRTR